VVVVASALDGGLCVLEDLPGFGWLISYKNGGFENASATCCAEGSRTSGLAAVMTGTPHSKVITLLNVVEVVGLVQSWPVRPGDRRQVRRAGTSRQPM
jgi:hypothetical protein